MKIKVALKKCLSYDLDKLEEALTESLVLLGGLRAIFKEGERALLKPNLLTSARPEEGITTHPKFVQATARVLKRAGLKVAIFDTPSNQKPKLNLDGLYDITGMRDVAEKENIALLTKTEFIEEDGVFFSSYVKEFDHIISLPKFKSHSLMTLTGAVKNIFGLTPRLYRVNLHKRFFQPEDFAKVLIDVYKHCKPTISFVDGIVAMEGNGPARHGRLRNLGLLAVSTDAFALDSILSCIMGLNPEDIPTNREGRLRNLGITDLGQIETVGDELGAFIKGDFRLPPVHIVKQIPPPILRFLNRFAEFRPKVDRTICNGCKVCIDGCPLSAITLSNKKAKIDYRKCVDCFCCLEVCPIEGMKIKSGPLIHIVKLHNAFRGIIKRIKLRYVS